MYTVQCQSCQRAASRIERIKSEECPKYGSTEWSILSPSKTTGLVYLIIGILIITVPIMLSKDLGIPPLGVTLIAIIGIFLTVIGYTIARGERT